MEHCGLKHYFVHYKTAIYVETLTVVGAVATLVLLY
jgi:hypothetical protein